MFFFIILLITLPIGTCLASDNTEFNELLITCPLEINEDTHFEVIITSNGSAVENVSVSFNEVIKKTDEIKLEYAHYLDFVQKIKKILNSDNLPHS